MSPDRERHSSFSRTSRNCLMSLPMLLRNMKSANTPLASEVEKPVSTSRKLFISAMRKSVSRMAMPWGTPFRISVAIIRSRGEDWSDFISNKEKIFYFNCLIIYRFVHLIMFLFVSLQIFLLDLLVLLTLFFHVHFSFLGAAWRPSLI